MIRAFLAVVCSLAFSTLAFNAQAAEPPAPTMPKEFEALKALVGDWDAVGQDKDKDHDMDKPGHITYALTSAGSVLMERFYAGTPHEMVSMYHADGDKLAFTHYCAMGNHPTLVFKKRDGNTFTFEATDARGMKSMNDLHMHQLVLTLVDKDHVTQEWTSAENKAKKKTSVFQLTRAKG